MKYRSQFLNSISNDEIENLKKLYLNDNYSCVDLGLIYKKSQETISRALKELNIVVYPRSGNTKSKPFKENLEINTGFNEKYVYKITNIINNKVYIGQTLYPERRWKDYKDLNRNHSIRLKTDMELFGIDNFKFEILYHGSEYNEKEIFYIEKYDSTNSQKGYNSHGGGDCIGSSENTSQAIINFNIASEIIELLINTSLKQIEIANMFNISEGIVNKINLGNCWRNSNFEYPLRENYKLDNKIIKNIIDLLQNTHLTYNEIAEKMKIKNNGVISRINTGASYKQDDILYPIRRQATHRRKLSYNDIEEIIDKLINSTLTQSQIAKQYSVNSETIRHINIGYRHIQPNLQYPLRKTNNRGENLNLIKEV